jgi:hypothetical protein
VASADRPLLHAGYVSSMCQLSCWAPQLARSAQKGACLCVWPSAVSPTCLQCQNHAVMSQGYGDGEVTILTPYVGQLRLLRQEVGRYMTAAINDRDAQDLADLEVQT